LAARRIGLEKTLSVADKKDTFLEDLVTAHRVPLAKVSDQ
jgi:hypothetical protein